MELSAQQLVDCSWGTGNHGCKGGHYAAALSWIYTHQISTDKSYGKYLGQVRPRIFTFILKHMVTWLDQKSEAMHNMGFNNMY